LAEVKEYNFLGNIIDNKGRFKRSAQELSKKGLKAFFSLKKYLSEFLHVPVQLSCKLFDSLIRPIILYNSEIWWKTITIFIKPRIDRRLMEVIVISCHLLIDLVLKKGGSVMEKYFQ
jgi:hypothetical protein